MLCHWKQKLNSDNQQSIYRCNELMRINSMNKNANNGVNKKFLTLMCPPSLQPNATDFYKDSYLRQYQNKLYKLQSFISTPDLTLESGSSSHTSCADYDSNREVTELQLLRPDVIQMHAFQMHDTQKQPSTVHVYQCNHHHQHNQNNSTIVNAKQIEPQKHRQNTTSPITSTRF